MSQDRGPGAKSYSLAELGLEVGATGGNTGLGLQAGSQGLNSAPSLVDQLRALSRHEHSDTSLGADAADEIERLRAKLDYEAVEGLRVLRLIDDMREQMQADRHQALRWRDDSLRRRERIERLRGVCKHALGLLRDAGRDDEADEVHALIGDMEPP